MPSSHLVFCRPVEPDGQRGRRTWMGGWKAVCRSWKFSYKKLQRAGHAVRCMSHRPHATPTQRRGRPGPQIQDSLSVSPARPSVAGRGGNRGQRQLSRPSPCPQPQPCGHLHQGSGGRTVGLSPLQAGPPSLSALPALHPQPHLKPTQPSCCKPKKPPGLGGQQLQAFQGAPTPPYDRPHAHKHTRGKQGSLRGAGG